MDPSTHRLWTLLICAEHYLSLQPFPIRSASNQSLTMLLILWASERNLATLFMPWASSCNLVVYTILTCTHKSHRSKHNSYPNTRRCKILPLQSNLLGDVGSLGLGCPMIAVRTSGHDLKFFAQRIACFEKCLSTHAAWSPSLNDYEALTACRRLRAAKHVDLVQWSFPDITSLFFLGYC